MVAGKLEDSSQEIEDRDQKKTCGAGFRDRTPLRARDQAARQTPHITTQLPQTLRPFPCPLEIILDHIKQ